MRLPGLRPLTKRPAGSSSLSFPLLTQFEDSRCREAPDCEPMRKRWRGVSASPVAKLAEPNMGAEVAVRGGFGTVIIDVRRGDGPKQGFNFTMASLATTDALIERSPEAAAGAVRAIVKTHRALKEDVTRATAVGRKLFPPAEAEIIADLIRRDLPYYDAAISEDFVAGMNGFARDVGVLSNSAGL